MPSKTTTSARRRSSLPPAKHLQQLRPTADPIVALTFSRTGQYLAVALQHGTILLYVVQSAHNHSSDTRPLLASPIRTYRGHTADVLHLSFSPNHFLASASMDRHVRLWHPNSSSYLRDLLHPDMATSTSFNTADDDVLLTGCCDGLARVWRLAEGRAVSASQTGTVVTTAMFTSPWTVAVGTYDGKLLRWSPHTSFNSSSSNLYSLNETVLDVRSQKRPSTQAARLSAVVVNEEDGKARRTYVTAEGGRMYELWDNAIIRGVKAEKARKSSTPLSASASTDGRFVTLDAVSEKVRILDLARKKESARMKGREARSTAVVEVVAFRDGIHVTSASIAPEAVRRRTGRGRVIGDAVMMVVGGDNGTFVILEQFTSPM